MKMNGKKKLRKKQKGFSLLEAVLSVFLLAVGMVAAISLMAGGNREAGTTFGIISDTQDSRDQVIASMLAQEGIELFRSLRDNRWVQGTSPPYYSSDSWSFCTDCTLDSNKNNCVADYRGGLYCNGVINNYLYYYNSISDKNYFRQERPSETQPAANRSKFQRRIYVNESSDMKIVSSVVLWGSTTYSSIYPTDPSSNPSSVTNCTASKKCAFAQAIFTRWGE